MRYLLLIVCLLPFFSTAQASYLERQEVQKFIQEMEKTHKFSGQELNDLFRNVKQQKSVLEAIARPAEAKPWHEYRPIFLVEVRIKEGVEFWQKHEALLARIEAEYGVPAAILVSIVGVETRYGRYKGKFPALDTLATLAFDYPKRARFFRSELEHFLLLVRDEGFDPKRIKGSYAAAMGMPQFISSSYREYAIDFDADGRRDLWNNEADVLGSVANYFKRHGWQRDEEVVIKLEAKDNTAQYKNLLHEDLKPSLSLQDLQSNETTRQLKPATQGPFSLFELETKKDPELWLGYKNFYVITRYNHSRLYAMAVFQLSQEIKNRREALQIQVSQ